MTAIGFFIGAVIGWWLVLLCKSVSISSHHGYNEDYEVSDKLEDLIHPEDRSWVASMIEQEEKRRRR